MRLKKNKRVTVSRLAQIAGLDLDDTLLILWQAGLEEINDPSDILVGARLVVAQRALSLPSARQLKSLDYWQRLLSVNESQLRGLLAELGVQMSSKGRRLPRGSIRSLRSLLSQGSSSRNVNSAITAVAIPNVSASSNNIPDRHATQSAETHVHPSQLEWKIVGHKRDVRCLSLEEVLGIHHSLVEDFRWSNNPITPPGPRNNDIIASAVFRQHTSVGNESKYPSVEMCAAALLHSLVHNHPFHNGNKRTALVSMLVLLDENALILTASEEDLFRFVITLSQHRLVDGSTNLADREVLAISEWIKANSRRIERGERPIPFRNLRRILLNHGCQLDHSASGSNMKITRMIVRGGILRKTQTLTTNISYGGEGREVLVPSVNKIRAELHLNENHGIDSAAFYADLPSPKDEFIVKYRKILNRLAKL